MPVAISLVIFIILLFVLRKMIMVVPEGTVVKTFIFGRSGKSYGPGLYVGWFDKAILKQIKLKIGTIGLASSETTIEVDGHQIPAKYVHSIQIGSAVRIEKFEGMEPLVTDRDVPNERIVLCDKCGHSNKIRV